jgi:hypothetical protein
LFPSEGVAHCVPNTMKNVPKTINRESLSLADLEYIQHSIHNNFSCQPLQSMPSFESKEAYQNRFRKSSSVLVSGAPFQLKPRPAAEPIDFIMPSAAAEVEEKIIDLLKGKKNDLDFFDEIKGWEEESQELPPQLISQVSYNYLTYEEVVQEKIMSKKKIIAPTALARRFASKKQQVNLNVDEEKERSTDDLNSSEADNENPIKNSREIEKQVPLLRPKTAPHWPRQTTSSPIPTFIPSFPNQALKEAYGRTSIMLISNDPKSDPSNKLATIRRKLCQSANTSRKSSPVPKVSQQPLGVIVGKRWIDVELRQTQSTTAIKKLSNTILPDISTPLPRPRSSDTQDGWAVIGSPYGPKSDPPPRFNKDDAPWLLDKAGLDVGNPGLTGPKRFPPRKLSPYGFRNYQ